MRAAAALVLATTLRVSARPPHRRAGFVAAAGPAWRRAAPRRLARPDGEPPPEVTESEAALAAHVGRLVRAEAKSRSTGSRRSSASPVRPNTGAPEEGLASAAAAAALDDEQNPEEIWKDWWRTRGAASGSDGGGGGDAPPADDGGGEEESWRSSVKPPSRLVSWNSRSAAARKRWDNAEYREQNLAKRRATAAAREAAKVPLPFAGLGPNGAVSFHATETWRLGDEGPAAKKKKRRRPCRPKAPSSEEEAVSAAARDALTAMLKDRLGAEARRDLLASYTAANAKRSAAIKKRYADPVAHTMDRLSATSPVLSFERDKNAESAQALQQKRRDAAIKRWAEKRHDEAEAAGVRKKKKPKGKKTKRPAPAKRKAAETPGPPVAVADMMYRELQALAKRRGIPAKGKTEVLRAALLAAEPGD